MKFLINVFYDVTLNDFFDRFSESTEDLSWLVKLWAKIQPDHPHRTFGSVWRQISVVASGV